MVLVGGVIVFASDPLEFAYLMAVFILGECVFFHFCCRCQISAKACIWMFCWFSYEFLRCSFVMLIAGKIYVNCSFTFFTALPIWKRWWVTKRTWTDFYLYYLLVGSGTVVSWHYAFPSWYDTDIDEMYVLIQGIIFLDLVGINKNIEFSVVRFMAFFLLTHSEASSSSTDSLGTATLVNELAFWNDQSKSVTI